MQKGWMVVLMCFALAGGIWCWFRKRESTNHGPFVETFRNR